MSATPNCSQCGQPLPARAPGGLCPRCLLAGARESPPKPKLIPLDAPFRRLGDYELLERIAEGGMGVVYRARQFSLNRIVAIKMIQPGKLTSPEALLRFQAEAEAAASLHHPNIVPIHETGESTGTPYFSMAFIAGRDLAAAAKDEPLPARRAAAIVEKTAAAVHYAHQQGLLHRDLKPSNVILDAADEPHVTDFGLARRVDLESRVTWHGQVFGSPRFMPPEQASGRNDLVGARSDVYGLGAILYYLLTARPPFVGEKMEAVLNQVLHQDPVSPRLLNPDVPRDLETICLKCLEKDPAHRYTSAQELADDLGRFRRDEPVRARPTGPAGKAWKWCRRRPALAGLAGALMLAIGFGLAGVTWQWRRAENQTRATERREYAANVALAQRLIENRRFDSAREILFQHAPERYRSWEWGWLQRNCNEDLATLHGLDPWPLFVCFSPDSRSVAAACVDGTVRLFEAATGREIRLLTNHSSAVSRVRFSPDGRLLASASYDTSARIWDAASGKELLQIKHSRAVFDAVFRPGTAQVATVCFDGKIRLWDTVTGQPTGLEFEGEEELYGASFSPDGRQLAISGSGAAGGEAAAAVRLWRPETGEVRTLQGHPGARVRGTAWHPKGDLLATIGSDGRVGLWDVQAGRELAPFEIDRDPGPLFSLDFSPDGERLAVAGTHRDDANVDVYNLRSRRVEHELLGHSRPVDAVTFSPDGRLIATACRDGTAKIWSAMPLGEYVSLEGHEQPVWAVAVSPDGRRVATGSFDQTAKIWDAHSGRLLQNIAVRFPAISLAFNPRGDQLVTVGPENAAWIWSLAESPASGTPAEPVPATRAASQETNRVVRVLRGHARAVLTVAWSADGRWVATGGKDAAVRIWDAQTGGFLRSLEGHKDAVVAVAFAPGRSLLASGGLDGKVRLWEPDSGRLLRVLSRHTASINALAFSPDGEWLASASQDSSVRLWRSESGREVHHFAGFASSPTGVCFSPDGKRLATAAGGDDVRAEWNRDRQVVIRDVESGLQLVNVAAHENAVYAVAFGDGGRLLVTGSADNTARIRDAFPWKEPPPASNSGLSRAAMLEDVKRTRQATALEAARASHRQDPAQIQPRQSVKTDFGVVNLSLPGWKTQPAFAIPPRDAEATTNQLDLAGVYNVALGESWTPIRTTLHADLNLAELPAGAQRFAGVLFDVRGLVQLRRGTLDTSHFPERVAVETRRSFARLHALHGVRWQSVDGKAVGGFVLHYADGRKAELPIVYGQHVFCELALKTVQERSAGAELAWSGADPTGRPEYAFRLYEASFANPHPDLEVVRIEYFSSLGKSAPFLLALTLE